MNERERKRERERERERERGRDRERGIGRETPDLASEEETGQNEREQGPSSQ